MKKARIGLGVAGVCLWLGVYSGFSQSSDLERKQGPDRILELLNEKERNFIQGKADAGDLTEEEVEHANRIKRLHQLESEKEIEAEPAGAQFVSTPVRAIQESEIEDLEIQQQENTSVMMRDMARLRAEVMRLRARVQALEMELDGTELDGTVDSLEGEAEPRFYLPIR